MPNKTQPGNFAPEKTKLIFERTFLGIGVGLGLVFLLLVVIGRPFNDTSGAHLERWNGIAHFLIIGGMALLSGLAGWSIRRRRHRKRAIRDDLLRNGERFTAKVVEVAEDVSTMVNDRHPWLIHAQCEIEGRLYEFRSWDIWEDPSSRLVSGTIDVYVIPNDLTRYYVDIRSLESGTEVEKSEFTAAPKQFKNRHFAKRGRGKTEEVTRLPRSDASWLSRHFTVPRFLFVLSLPFLAGGGVWLEKEITFLLDGELLEGRLEEIRPRRLSKGRTWYVISYQDPLGKTGILKSHSAPTKRFDPRSANLLDRLFPERPMEGEGVILRADWQNGRIRVEKWNYWIPPMFLIIPGAMFFALAWYSRGKFEAKTE